MNIQRVSPHFTLAELTRTNCRIANSTDCPVICGCLQDVCLNILEPVRSHFDQAVIIHSGYRSPAVNTAIGGSKTSQHCRGQAVDFHVAGHSVHEVAQWVSENLDFDQLILENFVPHLASSGWVHCSYSKSNRNQELTKFKGSSKYYAGINLDVPAH
jgi:zinc D-Ala-D-Ala carboxypeptidase